ncbi:MAG: glycosyltransferase [Chloroflexota bacterium]|nr:MAG: glycosyltransferase [Chloroflexota bacterium]
MTPKVRILHIETRHRRGGAERNLLHTALWEADRGYEVHVALGPDSFLDEMPPSLTIHTIPSLRRAVSPVNDLRAYLQLKDLIRELRCDLVHTHQSKAGIIGRMAARGQVGTVVHTVHMASFGPAYRPASSHAFVRAERLCARWTNLIVSVGEELRQMYLEAGIGTAERTVVIRSPIELDNFALIRGWGASERREARHALRLPIDGNIAVVVASLEPRKRVGLVLTELAPLLRSGQLTLAVAGDGPERGTLERDSANLDVSDEVRFLGHVSDMPRLLGAADVLVHASTVEGVPQVTIQAMAAGLPIVATEMIGIHEIPSSGIAVVPKSGAGLRETVLRMTSEAARLVPMEDLAAWRSENIDAALESMHRSVTRSSDQITTSETK